MNTTESTRVYALTDTDIIMGEKATQYVLRVRDLPVEDKPRENLLALGPADLTSSELLSILLGVGTKKEDVLSMSGRILREYGERAVVNEKNPQRLADSLKIPLVKACQIVASFELGRHRIS